RPFKKEQREFRTVEEELAKRDVLAAAPDAAHREQVVEAETALARARAASNAVRAKADEDLRALQTQQFTAEKKYADMKADYDSLMSYYNIEVEQHGPDSAAAKQLLERTEAKHKQMDELKYDLKTGIEKIKADIDAISKKKFQVTVGNETVN